MTNDVILKWLTALKSCSILVIIFEENCVDNDGKSMCSYNRTS